MSNFDRRAFLKIGSLQVFGFLGYGDVLRMRAQSPAPAKRDISIIHLWLTGGMSHLDTFDPKPDVDARYRSLFKPIATNVSGIQVSEHLPLTAQQADKFVIVRSMTHKQAAHEAACNLILSGHAPLGTLQHPAMQCVIAKELGRRNEMPAAVSIPAATGSWEKAGFLGPRYNPFNAGNPNTENYKVQDMDLPMGVDWSRMDHRRSLLAVVDEKFRRLDTTGVIESMDSYYQTAFQLMHSERAKKAFRMEEEPEALREKYGRTSLGQGALLARRLVETGVRFVTVSRGFNTWDHHKDIFPLLANTFLPEFDRAYATLLEDLHQRGLLDSTLVIATGEFGRTPEINGMAGRDHWPNAFSLTLAGAGLTGGRVLGSSDEKGMFVKDHPVEVDDLTATIYKKLGINYEKEYISNIGRPFKLADKGRPVDFLLA
ncbi:MAG TPA: DUF1501 domain-containing protein [Bryobacterales bacterium]|nr:DUF1501 domain-containing protein [Bryobacterales bacterium]